MAASDYLGVYGGYLEDIRKSLAITFISQYQPFANHLKTAF